MRLIGRVSDMPVGVNTPAASGYEARWEQHNAERQRLILRAAVELLKESPAGTDVPVRSIAERAGVAKSVVYRQFSGKDELERRLRSYVIDDFAAVLDAKLDVTSGSIREILARTIETVVDWMSEHPRLYEFLRAGPTHQGEGSLDAVSELKVRMVRRSEAIIASFAQLLGMDDAAFESVPFVVVTMVEATLAAWIRESGPRRSRAQMISTLTDITWFVLDGAARSIGLEVDPDDELTAVLAELKASVSG
jgi:AcrR family transcriptional regulator